MIINKGDLIGYFNMDQETEYGIVISDKPYAYDSCGDRYLVVDVVWPDDPNGDSTTREPVSNITSDSWEHEGIWLQSSLPVR
tara:strand:- start:3094 stop:3339 length:246 start_codon:yes stop_codon:yes gene_type:complete